MTVSIWGRTMGWKFYLFFLIILFRSFWFVGGWMAIRWPHWVYAGVGILTLISTAGYFKYLFVRVIRRKEDVLLSNPVLLLMTLCGTSGFRSNFFLLWICCGRVRTGKVPVSRPSSLCRSIHIRAQDDLSKEDGSLSSSRFRYLHGLHGFLFSRREAFPLFPLKVMFFFSK